MERSVIRTPVPHCAIGRRFAPTRRLYAGYEDFSHHHLASSVIASSILTRDSPRALVVGATGGNSSGSSFGRIETTQSKITGFSTPIISSDGVVELRRLVAEDADRVIVSASLRKSAAQSM